MAAKLNHVFWAIFMTIGIFVGNVQNTCTPAKTLVLEGDIYIIGLLAFHQNITQNSTKVEDLDTQGLLWSLAFIHTVEKYNKLFGMTIGYNIYDTCNEMQRTEEILLELILDQKYSLRKQNVNKKCYVCKRITRKPIIAVISRLSIPISKIVASILAGEEIPYFSFLGKDKLNNQLLNSNIKRYFMHIKTIAPREVFLISELIQRYNWTYIGLVASNDDIGQNGFDLIRKALSPKVCLMTKSFDPKNSSSIDDVIIALKYKDAPKIIILWTGMGQVKLFLKEAEKQHLFYRTWIANTAWSTMTTFFQTLNPKVIQGLIQSSGSLRLIEVADGFWTYFYKRNPQQIGNNTWLSEFFQKANKIYNIKINTQLSDLHIFFDTDEAKYVTNTVKQIIRNVNKYTKHLGPLKDMTRITKERYLKILQKKVSVGYKVLTNIFPFISMLTNSKTSNSTIIYWPKDQSLKTRLPWAGNYGKLTSPLISLCSKIHCKPAFHPVIGEWIPPTSGVWDSKLGWVCLRCKPGLVSTDGRKCKICEKSEVLHLNQTICQKYSIEYFNHNDKQSSLIYTLMVIGLTAVAISFMIVIRFRKTPIIRSMNFIITLMQLSGYMVLFVLPQLWLMKPTNIVCILQPSLPAFFYILILGTTLTKTQKLLFIFQARSRLSKQSINLSKAVEWLVILILMGLLSFILTIYFILKPPKAMLTKYPNILVEKLYCNTTPHFHVMILFILLIVTITLIQAYRARKLPSNFSDTRSIVYAMFTLMIITLALVPIQLGRSLEDRKPLVSVLLVILPNMATLPLMFGYKFYIILFYPELNTNAVHRTKIYNVMQQEAERKCKTVSTISGE